VASCINPTSGAWRFDSIRGHAHYRHIEAARGQALGYAWPKCAGICRPRFIPTIFVDRPSESAFNRSPIEADGRTYESSLVAPFRNLLNKAPLESSATS
jgi:hypothetical protein